MHTDEKGDEDLIGTLIVSEEEMRAAAAELSGFISNMDDCFQKMMRTMERTASYWTGAAGDAHRQLYLEQVETTVEIIARYQEHATDLNEMAGIYVQSASNITSLIDALPTSDL